MKMIAEIIALLFLIYFTILNISYLVIFIFSYVGIKKYRKKIQLNNYMLIYQSRFTPPISLIVPAYNEEGSIIKNTNVFLSNFDYPEYEVIVVNDGSKDGTLLKLINEYECEIGDYPYKRTLMTKSVINIYTSRKYTNLKVIDKINGGKADALNVGINVSKYPYFGSIDADTILERNSYMKVIMPAINDPERVIATGGIIGVLNGSKIEENRVSEVKFPDNILAKFQVIEYLRAFLFGRYAWSIVNTLPIISGAFGLFKKSAVIECVGYSTEKTKFHTVGEDMELVMKLHKYFREKKRDYRIVFVPDPLSWTEVPEDLKTLSNQRGRWHRGLMEVMWSNKKMLFNYKYGLLGMVAMPYYLIFEMAAPLIEIAGYIMLPYFYFKGLIELDIFLLFLIIAVLVGVLNSLLALFLEMITFRHYRRLKDIFEMALFAVLENFGYRHLTLLFRVKGIIKQIMGSKEWGKMKRKGF
jgi:cellulose synthase/poly-beta-1,6-N-acetylglucosamine synthase-like glycosyltransferase